MCETPKSPPGDYNVRRRSRTSTVAKLGCETPKSPPGDYNRADRRAAGRRQQHAECETPKSPPGDYNPMKNDSTLSASGTSRRCETPKSPPGDYNRRSCERRFPRIRHIRVKHLNPRQGITTGSRYRRTGNLRQKLRISVKHLNPRQGITTHLHHAILSIPSTAPV